MCEQPVDLVDPLHPLGGEFDAQGPVRPHCRGGGAVVVGGRGRGLVEGPELGEVVLHQLGAVVAGRSLEEKTK